MPYIFYSKNPKDGLKNIARMDEEDATQDNIVDSIAVVLLLITSCLIFLVLTNLINTMTIVQ